MKITVIGAGAIGSLVAGYLTKAGCDVELIGRADHADAINANGLKVKKHGAEETIKVKAATAMKAPCDLAIFCVKTQDIEQAYQENHEHIENALILTTQNGVQADNILSSHFEPKQMLSSIVMFGATYIKPGEVIFNFPGDWIIGKPYTVVDQKVYDIADMFKAAFPVTVSSNIMGMKWLKLFVNFNNCLPALTGKSMQETFADKDLCKLSIMLLKEGVGIVQKAGTELVSLPQFPVERVMGLASMPTPQGAEIIHKTLTSLSKEPLYGSILQSIMRKRQSEIDFINGEVVVIAKNIRLEAPLNRKVVDMVHQVERSDKFFTPEEIKREFNLDSIAKV